MDELLKRLASDLKNAKGTAGDMQKGKADYPIGDIKPKSKEKQ